MREPAASQSSDRSSSYKENKDNEHEQADGYENWYIQTKEVLNTICDGSKNEPSKTVFTNLLCLYISIFMAIDMLMFIVFVFFVAAAPV